MLGCSLLGCCIACQFEIYAALPQGFINMGPSQEKHCLGSATYLPTMVLGWAIAHQQGRKQMRMSHACTRKHGASQVNNTTMLADHASGGGFVAINQRCNASASCLPSATHRSASGARRSRAPGRRACPSCSSCSGRPSASQAATAAAPCLQQSVLLLNHPKTVVADAHFTASESTEKRLKLARKSPQCTM